MYINDSVKNKRQNEPGKLFRLRNTLMVDMADDALVYLGRSRGEIDLLPDKLSRDFS